VKKKKRYNLFKGTGHERWEQDATISYHRWGMKKAMAPFWDPSRRRAGSEGTYI